MSRRGTITSVRSARTASLVAHEEQDAVGLWLHVGYERDEQISRFVRNL